MLHKHSAEFPRVCELIHGCYSSSLHLNGRVLIIFIPSVTESWLHRMNQESLRTWLLKDWKNSFGWPCVFFFPSTLVHRKRLLWEQLSAVLVQGSLLIIFGFSLLSIRTPDLLFYSVMNWKSQSDSHNTEFGAEIGDL